MTKEKRIRDLARLHKSLTDPDEKAKARREAEKVARMSARRADTGL